MLILGKDDLQALLDHREVIDRMRAALIAHSRGECSTPMPMHLDVPASQGEVHMKASYRQGGPYYVLKVASTFAGAGNGMMMMFSAETGAPAALLEDEGHLTDARTAAAAAMVALELKRSDTVLGILGTGIQARLQAQLHAAVLNLDEICIWGRRPEAVERCVSDIAALVPEAQVRGAATPAEVARRARLIVTCTASREALLSAADILPGSHISAVGSDSPGKRELSLDTLESASLILVDSLVQCERLGELKYALHLRKHAVEVGSYCLAPAAFDPAGSTICDFTGLGVEDLYIAEYCLEKQNRSVTA